MSRSVCIVPGIFSGAHTTAKMTRLLKNAGYTIAPARDADVLIAHSAGCLWVQNIKPNQMLVLVNPPYWPGRSITQRSRARWYSNLQFHSRGIPFRRWIIRNMWGVYYTLHSPLRTAYIIRNMGLYDLTHVVAGRRVVLVRNALDDWLTPDCTELTQANPGLTFVTLPGDHDDFNYHPETYVRLLQSLHT